MGNIRSSFRPQGDSIVSKYTHPSNVNWIGEHAGAVGPVVEVERLWTRFQQLGCNNDGILESSVLQRPPASEDIFFKNVLVTFRSEDGNISFQTFCNAMKWAETSTIDTKMNAIFNMLNNGKPVTKDILVRVLKRVYPRESQSSLEVTADSFIEQMDNTNSGIITLSQWSTWARRMPSEQMEALLAFNIIPEEINIEAHRAFTSQAISSLGDSRNVPTDTELNEIAKKVKKYDWAILANKLNITQSDVSQIQSRYQGDATEQVFQMLKKWKKKESKNASRTDLENALRQCGMNDAALVLRS